MENSGFKQEQETIEFWKSRVETIKDVFEKNQNTKFEICEILNF